MMVDAFDKIEKVLGIGLIAGLAYLGYKAYTKFSGQEDAFSPSKGAQGIVQGNGWSIAQTPDGDITSIGLNPPGNITGTNALTSLSGLSESQIRSNAYAMSLRYGLLSTNTPTDKMNMTPASESRSASVSLASSKSSGVTSTYKQSSTFGNSEKVGVVVPKSYTVTSKALKGGSKTY